MVECGVEQGQTDLRRRRMIAGLLVSLVVVAVPTVLVALNNPWRYVYLMPLGRSPVVVIVLILAPVMLGVAARLVLRNKLMVRVVAGVAAVLTILMCLFGYQVSMATSVYGNDSDGARSVVAVSSSGSFELVVVRYSVLMTDFDIVRLRSRSGLSSREASQDLACFATPFDPLGPEDTFDSARFVSEHEVEVSTKAGEPWTTTFDPQTLLAAETVSHGCGD